MLLDQIRLGADKIRVEGIFSRQLEVPKLPSIMTDPTTQSNYLQIATEHVTFDWNVDFEDRVIAGSAIHRLLVKEDDVRQVM